MLTTVIIILREVLEAAFLISLLLTLLIKLRVYRAWFPFIVLPGVAAAAIYAHYLSTISGWFSGVGQEVVNTVLLSIIAFLLTLEIICSYRFYLHRNSTEKYSDSLLLTLNAALIIVLAMAREGAEIIVYFAGGHVHPGEIPSMIVGGIIGSGLGLCSGILFFIVLYNLQIATVLRIAFTLFILMAAGIASEAMRSCIQAGLIITNEPLWDSSNILSESSITGQLFYAVFSYEATPTMEEVLAWVITALAISSIILWMRLHQTK